MMRKCAYKPDDKFALDEDAGQTSTAAYREKLRAQVEARTVYQGNYERVFKNMEHERKRVAYMRSDKGFLSIPESKFKDFASPYGTKNLNVKKEHQNYFEDLRERKFALQKKMEKVKSKIVDSSRTNA